MSDETTTDQTDDERPAQDTVPFFDASMTGLDVSYFNSDVKPLSGDAAVDFLLPPV